MIRFAHGIAQKALFAAAFAATLASLTGCGLGNAVVDSTHDTVAPAISGILHGGPNPAVGARVAIYATTSSNYGVGVQLQEANQQGSSAHQDTDQFGQFSFAGGYTCPAGQQAYVVAYGGNTGGNVNNPNSILMTALGPCENISSSTSVYVNEATTVAAVYALANFISVTTDSVTTLPAVFIGAPATNNGKQGCVPNTYYVDGTNTALCTATTSAGLRHAFANATAMVNTSTGVINTANANGGAYPTVQLNTIANIVQSCVNSAGGGGTTLAGTTTTTGSGTSHDGTNCGRLFAYTSYTNNGLATGTLTSAGNTVDAIKNLVKRPTGTASTFDTSCSSNSGTGTTTATTCLFNLVSGFNGFFTPQLSTAPPDYVVAISYPKGNFSNSTTNVFTTGAGCGATTTNNGLLYPGWVATDINDNVTILNDDQSTPKCGNVIAIGPDGTLLGANAPDNTLLTLRALANDAYGHAIVPNPGADGVRFYEYNAGGLADSGDSGLALKATILSGGTNASGSTTNAAYKGYYAMSDSTGRIYVTAQNSLNTVGFLAPTTLSHPAPAYTANALPATTTSSMQGLTIDINNNAFAPKSTFPIGVPFAATTKVEDTSGITGVTSSNTFAVTDLSGNMYQVVNNGATVGTSQTVVVKYPYVYTPGAGTGGAGGSLAFGTNTTATSPTFAFPTNTNLSTNDGLSVSPRDGIIDGNNVMWFGDVTGTNSNASNSTGTGYIIYSSLRGYDTVNNYGTAQLVGCRTPAAVSYTITTYTVGATSTSFTTSGVPPSTTGTVTLSGFTLNTALNGQAVVVASNVTTSPYSFTVNSTFGLAANTYADAGIATAPAGTKCGSNPGDPGFPNTSAYNFYGTRATAVDTMGNLWFAGGTQGTVVEVLGLAAPTLPNYIHNGTSQKP